MMRLALIQMLVGPDKASNLKKATDLIAQAVVKCTPHLICLPECFNSPYGSKYFDTYAEPVPDGPSCQAIAAAAKQHNTWIVAGTIPERGTDGKLYNCSATFNPEGELVGTFRKLHLFDIEIPGQFAFKESSTLCAGKELFSFQLPLSQSSVVTVGLGICYDVRFPELSLVYTHQYGCQLLLFPGCFSTKTGPAHWELLSRARSLDTQCYVAMCSPACNPEADYISHAESIVTCPWGTVLAKAGKEEEIILADLDFSDLKRVREAIPVGRQRRLDVYTMPKLVRKP